MNRLQLPSSLSRTPNVPSQSKNQILHSVVGKHLKKENNYNNDNNDTSNCDSVHQLQKIQKKPESQMEFNLQPSKICLDALSTEF